MWRKGNPLTLLVELQTSTATMEKSVEIPLETGNRTAIRTQETRIERHMYPSVNHSTVYNS